MAAQMEIVAWTTREDPHPIGANASDNTANFSSGDQRRRRSGPLNTLI